MPIPPPPLWAATTGVMHCFERREQNSQTIHRLPSQPVPRSGAVRCYCSLKNCLRYISRVHNYRHAPTAQRATISNITTCRYSTTVEDGPENTLLLTGNPLTDVSGSSKSEKPLPEACSCRCRRGSYIDRCGKSVADYASPSHRTLRQAWNAQPYGSRMVGG